jgi:hypothetical protein
MKMKSQQQQTRQLRRPQGSSQPGSALGTTGMNMVLLWRGKGIGKLTNNVWFGCISDISLASSRQSFCIVL